MTLMKHVANAGIAVDGGASRLFAIRLLCCVAASCVSLTAEAVVATNYVDCKLADYTGHDGSSWQKAFKTIQEGVAAASSGDVVLVAAGDYDDGGAVDTLSGGGLYNRVFINRKAITLKSVAGAKETRIIGQFDSSTLNDPTAARPGLGDDAIRCLCVVASSAAEAPTVEGFTFADGATSAVDSGKECAKNIGGGILVCDANAAACFDCNIVDSVITNCIATRGGGLDGGNVIRCKVEDCDSFNGNSSAARHSSLFNCLIVRNGRRNSTCGTVEYIFSGVIVNCTFAGNACQALRHYPGQVYNCLFSENGSASLYVGGQNEALTNCLIDVNSVLPAKFDTCIKPADNFQLYAPALGDYRLLPTSAAIGAGSVAALERIPAAYRDKDFYGNPRTTGGSVNIGCQEAPAPAPKGGAVIFNFKASVNGFVGYCDKLHAYAASYPETFDVSLAPGAYTDDTSYFSVNGGILSTTTRWFPKWDDDRIGILAPTSSYISIARNGAAKTLWVQAGYAGGDSNGTSEKPYVTIQDAVTAAGTAKTVIKVRPGVYATGGAATASGHADGSMQMNRVATAGNQNLRIVSTDGPSATTILGWSDPEGDEWGCSANSYRCVYLCPGGTSYPQALQGFTLSGGRAAYYAGGAFMNNWGVAVIADCIITNCIAARAAGAYVGRLERCWVVDNFFNNNYNGSSYTYNDIVEQGVYVSCVFSANRSPDQLATHPIVGMAGTMLHCSGIDNGNSKMTDSNVIQLNCIWDSFRNVAGSGSGGGDFAVNVGSISSNGNKEFTAIDSPLSRALPYCRAYASSPAVYGGSADITNHFKYSMLDYEGKVIRFKDGKPTAGAFQDPAAGAIATTDGTSGGISPAGETAAGLAPGDVVTFSATKARQRPLIGLRVDGELLEGVSSYDWTVPATPCYSPLRIEAVYGTNWYVNAESGDDSRLGSSWGEARRTLEGVMTNAVSGDVVTAAPGRYDTGSMMHSPLVYGNTSVRSRVVVPQGVTLRSSDGAENTFIVGANASVPEDEYGNGEDAIRGVFLNTGARLCGFTVTGGRTAVSNTSDGDHGRGGGVYCRGEGGIYVEDCIISNNVALRGAGVYMGRHKRCRILHNHAIVNGAAFRNAYLSDCLVDYNTNPSGNGGVGYICWAFVNSIFGAHNSDGNGSGVIFGFTAGKTTSNELIPMVNSVILAGAVQNFGFASNTLYTSAAGFSAMATPIGDTCTRVAADDLQFDAMGHPVYGHCVAIDAGDASLRDASYGDLDVDGGQRVYNGKIDAGCCEFDWRPVYARIIGGTRAEVDAASPDVVRSVDGRAVSLVDGTSVDVTLSARRPGLLRYELKVKVYGEGTLTVVRDGEIWRTFTAQGGEETFMYDSADAVQSLTFAFAGAGSADILSCRSPSGVKFTLR